MLYKRQPNGIVLEMQKGNKTICQFLLHASFLLYLIIRNLCMQFLHCLRGPFL